MRRKTGAAVAALLAVLAASPASATVLNFELTGSHRASFQIDTETVPTSFSTNAFGSQFFLENVSGIFGGVEGKATLAFGTNLFADLNIFGTKLGFVLLSNDRLDLFSGNPADPVFALGTFNLSNTFIGQNDVLTISAVAAVPEASTWAMMIMGFAGVGLVAYRRKRALADVSIEAAVPADALGFSNSFHPSPRAKYLHVRRSHFGWPRRSAETQA